MQLGPPDTSGDKSWEFLKSEMAVVAILKNHSGDVIVINIAF